MEFSQEITTAFKNLKSIVDNTRLTVQEREQIEQDLFLIMVECKKNKKEEKI
jgi:hypothetical protein